MNGDQGAKFVTFGCRLNTHESAVMQAHARAAGIENVIVFNTCAVTAEAERQARQAIRKARRNNPDAVIIVTGCAAQIAPATFAAMPEVNKVIGNDLKLSAQTWNDLAGQDTSCPSEDDKILLNDIMDVRETAHHLVEGIEGRTRAFVQVQNGCDHRCTFCIIPYGRGPSRSVPIGAITDQVRTLVQGGVKEIVFTGVDVTSYGADLPGAPSLGQMIRRVLALVPELVRLRLSSLDPVEIDPDLWQLIASEPRLCPHLHLSLQAGDDMILKRMKRRHLRQDVIAVCARARALRPDIVFGADIIAGFPTETEEMFARTLEIVTACDLTFLHVFPYSPRPGTPAARMPQVPAPVRRARAERLRTAGAAQEEKFLMQTITKTRQIIVEKESIGRTEHFALLRFSALPPDAPAWPVGACLTARVTGVESGFLVGEIVSA